MKFTEPILFRIKNRCQRILFKLVAFDDNGIKLQSPMGEPIKGVLIGATLIDPEGEEFMIKKISMQTNMIWVEKTVNKNPAA